MLDEIDLSPMPAEEVRAMRRRRNLSVKKMAPLVGTWPDTWSRWERRGAPPQWAFLLREWHDEAIDDIGPADCPPETVRALRRLAGDDGEYLQDLLGIHPTTVSRWCRDGANGRRGWGRALTVIAQIYGVDQ